MPSHYLYDAVHLLIRSLDQLQGVIRLSEGTNRSHSTLYDLREALSATETLLHRYAEQLLLKMSMQDRPTMPTIPSASHQTLSSLVDLLRCFGEGESNSRITQTDTIHQSASTSADRDRPRTYYPKRSATDSLLFRLIVALQLCLVRIDDARLAINGGSTRSTKQTITTPGTKIGSTVASQLPTLVALTAGILALQPSIRKMSWLDRMGGGGTSIVVTAQVGIAFLATQWIKRACICLVLTAKIDKAVAELEEWNRQWCVVQVSTPTNETLHSATYSNDDNNINNNEISNMDPKSRRLIEYAMREAPNKVSLWQSQGELRFLLLKRSMDVLYASVDTAMKVTMPSSHGKDASNWQMILTTAAVSSFYTLIGARQRAAEATSSSESARCLIHHAWGMVSLPALKSISLQASSFLKGAAVADRIEIAGVPCFVLSFEPAPELAAATKRYHRKLGHRNKFLSSLSTIDEQEEHTPGPTINRKPFAKSPSRYRQRDVILHLTAGGFFAHTIASDLPFLLDWSASTGACVICPEYDLLPEHTFPDALLQAERVYKELQSGEAVHVLGFEAHRIVLTGESTGGNLAASLCVKLCMDNDHVPTSASYLPPMPSSEPHESSRTEWPLPCAMVLSCPVLNLSLELSLSRVLGNQDPVLPSGLISAISDAYTGGPAGFSKQDPLVSPFYASDMVLSCFPPTLIFASSHDPLLDDSVVWNKRLRSLGVKSDLRAVPNLPHAYLGLGTAGFPEARDVQHQLIEWLNCQLLADLSFRLVEGSDSTENR